MKRLAPWWAKILIKLCLSRLPVSYAWFANLGVFRHGRMDEAEYAVGVFRQHFERVEFPGKTSGFTCLELGPGDSLASALIAAAHGASGCYLVDAGAYAHSDLRVYKELAGTLEDQGGGLPELGDCESVDELLQRLGGVYLTDGLASLRALPGESVDFIWSQAVLEHVRVTELDDTLAELWRVMRTGGEASHRVDFKDHLGGSLHNLRVPSSVWEQQWMARSGFYTNRVRLSELLRRFRRAGFETRIVQVDRWPEAPLARRRLAQEFKGLSDDDLRVSGLDVVLTKPADAPRCART